MCGIVFLRERVNFMEKLHAICACLQIYFNVMIKGKMQDSDLHSYRYLFKEKNV